MPVFNVIQRKINKRGEGPLYVSFCVDGKKIEIPVKYSISPDDFDKKKKRVKASCPFHQDVNLIINNIIARANDIFVKYRLKNLDLTITAFWCEYRNPCDYTSFFDFCAQYQRLRFLELADGTQRHHISGLKILHEYKNKINFDELTPDFFRRFVLYLRNKRGNKEVTIAKKLKTISVYLNEAVRMGYLKSNPIKEIPRRGYNETSATYLLESELKLLVDLYNQHTLSDTYQQVLEFFLFMCFTSLHIGDARALMIDQVRDNEIVYMRKKLRNTHPKFITVPLSDPAKAIIKRWVGNRTEGLIFKGLVCDYRVNKYLKEIAAMAGVETTVCAKVGRHTFATIYLRETRDINTLRAIMGHSNIKQTLTYAHVLDEDRREGIKTFNRFVI